MKLPQPFFQEAGYGPGVVCLHSNASHGNQWRALMQTLEPTHHVLAPDLYGAGRSPEWMAKRHLRLADEVLFLDPVFDRAGDPFVLVGHSYGAAVALITALMYPERVAALALYEPTLFALVDADSPAPNEADGIRATVAHAAKAIDDGDVYRAAELFIDYWMGVGAWQRTPDARKPAIAASMVNIRRWGRALLTETTPLAAFAAIGVPVLYMTGGRSPLSSLGVARLLAPTLPAIEFVEFREMGHMGPITHAPQVNARIARFVQSVTSDRFDEATTMH